MKFIGLISSKRLERINFKNSGLVSLLLVILLNDITFAFSPNSNQINPLRTIIFEEEKIFDLINIEREKKGLMPLIWNKKLAEIAKEFSEKMAKEKFFDHFDRDRKSVVDRARAKKVRNWRKIGENLFMSDRNENFVKIAVRGWMKSPSHRNNILDYDYDETGIGIGYARDGTIYITQVFMQNM